jgi:hypothetical protein
MRRVFISVVFVLVAHANFVWAQDPPTSEEKPLIESVDVTGVPDSKITGELRRAMQTLVGERFDQSAADEVGFQIQKQVGQRISAIRQIPGSTQDHVKLVFEFSNEDWNTNVNSRYTVESVELRGASESLISPSLREDLHKLVDEKLDEDRANNLERRLRRELRPNYVVSRKVERGSDRDHVRLIFTVERAPLLRFHKFDNYFVGQSKQGLSYSAGFDFHAGRNNLISLGVLDDGDVLIERDEGFLLGFENIKAGTEHLGFRLNYFDYDLKWKQETQLALLALPEVPGIYRERRSFQPRLIVAVDRRFQFDLGVDLTWLQMQYPVLHFQNANALVGAAIYRESWRDGGGTSHKVSATYEIRNASRNLSSDFVYTRHLGEVQYTLNVHRSQFLATGIAGMISGQAPLFERFDIGNTSTLRGWNKYDLAPAGGNRMAYGSLEYRYSVLQMFYDVGSVWQDPSPSHIRHSVGLGLHSRDDDNHWFITFGVPIRPGNIQPSKLLFMAGVRF